MNSKAEEIDNTTELEEEESENDKGTGIAKIVGIVISLVVGISLLSPIRDAIAKVPEGTKALPLLKVLPYVCMTVIILGAVAWFAIGRGEEKPVLELKPKLQTIQDRVREIELGNGTEAVTIIKPTEQPFYKARLFWMILAIGGVIGLVITMRSIFGY